MIVLLMSNYCFSFLVTDVNVNPRSTLLVHCQLCLALMFFPLKSPCATECQQGQVQMRVSVVRSAVKQHAKITSPCHQTGIFRSVYIVLVLMRICLYSHFLLGFSPFPPSVQRGVLFIHNQINLPCKKVRNKNKWKQNVTHTLVAVSNMTNFFSVPLSENQLAEKEH